MARSRKQKEQLVKDYVEKIQSSNAVYILEPKGVTANQSTALKKALYDLDSSYNVVKNSLFKIALDECGLDVDESIIDNQKAVVFSGEEVTESAKIIKTFSKDNKDRLSILGGYLKGKKVGANQVEALADLPPREVVLAQVLGTMNAPISGFVNVLAGNVRGIVNVINAIKDQKSE
ncbi:50S ribosomal protein L10 [Candidatus Dojkabacteria bacterium]|uniref:Large ribosomal subunit protein uL10 n=1 Tax=Candidatus Dojkabacteria bacterium TaxID=2099670 RepID=A0A955L8K4_9BACT|nr:50S ribosomal protein L10 [Candidatus Dojkabacteria bacterium]